MCVCMRFGPPGKGHNALCVQLARIFFWQGLLLSVHRARALAAQPAACAAWRPEPPAWRPPCPAHVVPGLQQSTHGAVQFAVYEELKYFASRINRLPTLLPGAETPAGKDASGSSSSGSSGSSGGQPGSGDGKAQARTLSSAELSLFAAASKLSASVFTYPTQVGVGVGGWVC